MSKTTLYIDIDDTLISQHHEGAGHDLRPGVITQLRGLIDLGFDCCWLTHWSEEDLSKLWTSLYAEDLVDDFTYIDWQSYGSKAAAVLAGPKDFYWMEDPYSTGELRDLKHANVEDRYIPVEPKGPWGFAHALHALFTKLAIDDKKMEKASVKIGWFYKALPDVSKRDQLEQGTLASGFVTNGKQHCGDCTHRLKGTANCIHPEVLKDPELKSRLTFIDKVPVIPIDLERECCAYINKGEE